MDKAILSHVKELKLEHLKDAYTKVDEIPFDFIRRRMSVVIEDKQEETPDHHQRRRGRDAQYLFAHRVQWRSAISDG